MGAAAALVVDDREQVEGLWDPAVMCERLAQPARINVQEERHSLAPALPGRAKRINSAR
jgi:hypothetical protein